MHISRFETIFAWGCGDLEEDSENSENSIIEAITFLWKHNTQKWLSNITFYKLSLINIIVNNDGMQWSGKEDK